MARGRKKGDGDTYNPELAKEILEKLKSCPSLRRICRHNPHLPGESTIRSWAIYHPDFAAQYRKAREQGCDSYAEKLLDICDDGENDFTVDENGKPIINWDLLKRSELRFRAGTWFLSKCAPKKYGEKIEETVIHEPAKPIEKTATADILKLVK